MNPSIKNTYALLIGVDQQSHPDLKYRELPDVKKDLEKLAAILMNPQICALPKEQIEVLLGQDSTKVNILDALENLQEKLEKDDSGNTTALIYFSGHGFLQPTDNTETFRLIPFDADPSSQLKINRTTILDEEWVNYISSLSPNRLLLIMDCCHAGASDAKDVVKKPTETSTASADSKPLDLNSNWEKIAELKGRAILQSCLNHELSYMYPEKGMSLFTYHLIQALTGHAYAKEGDKMVSVLQLMTYLSKEVPLTAESKFGLSQHPHFRYEGADFPIARLLGGKGFDPSGIPSIEDLNKLDFQVPKGERNNNANVSGDGNIVIQESSGSININQNRGKV